MLSESEKTSKSLKNSLHHSYKLLTQKIYKKKKERDKVEDILILLLGGR